MANRVMRSDAVRVLVDELAGWLRRSVVVDDPLVRQLYASRHYGDADPVRLRAMLQHDAGAAVVDHFLDHGVPRWTRPGFLPGAAELQLLPRLVAPLRAAGRFLGLLVVIARADDLTAVEVAEVARVADAVAVHLSAAAVAEERLRERTEQAVRAVCAPGDHDRDDAVTAVREAGLTGPVRVLVLAVTSSRHDEAQIALALHAAARTPLERSARGVAASEVSGQRATVLLQWRGELREHIQRVREGVGRVLGTGSQTLAGLGGSVRSVAVARESARQAAVALRAACRLPRLGGCADWAELGEYAPLLCLHDVPGDTRAATALRGLAAHPAGARLRETLLVYLDNVGSVPRTSSALNLHRSSLHYRLHQIQEITGMDLQSGSDRLALHLQLRLDELGGS